MKRILAPHKEQDGYAYYRLPSSNLPRSVFISSMEIVGIMRGMDEQWYPDDAPNQRIISSRRVEEAVETADFLKLCAEEGLAAERNSAGWQITAECVDPDFAGWGTTLREAYYRYKAKAGDAE